MKKIDIFNLSKYLKRTGDNKLARIGHVNHVLGTTIPLPENPQNGDALVYNSTSGLWEPEGDEWQEFTVTLTGNELQTTFSAPIDISSNFPTLNIATEYLDTEIYGYGIKGTVDFDFIAPVILRIGNSSMALDNTFVNNLASLPIPFIPFKIVGTYPGGKPYPIGGLVSTSVADATQGDSMLVLTVRWRIRNY